MICIQSLSEPLCSDCRRSIVLVLDSVERLKESDRTWFYEFCLASCIGALVPITTKLSQYALLSLDMKQISSGMGIKRAVP